MTLIVDNEPNGNISIGNGETVFVRNFRFIKPKPKKEKGLSWVEFSAPKKELFCLLLLGTVPEDGSGNIDPNEWMKKRGWIIDAGPSDLAEENLRLKQQLGSAMQSFKMLTEGNDLPLNKIAKDVVRGAFIGVNWDGAIEPE